MKLIHNDKMHSKISYLEAAKLNALAIGITAFKIKQKRSKIDLSWF